MAVKYLPSPVTGEQWSHFEWKLHVEDIWIQLTCFHTSLKRLYDLSEENVLKADL